MILEEHKLRRLAAQVLMTHKGDKLQLPPSWQSHKTLQQTLTIKKSHQHGGFSWIKGGKAEIQNGMLNEPIQYTSLGKTSTHRYLFVSLTYRSYFSYTVAVKMTAGVPKG